MHALPTQNASMSEQNRGGQWRRREFLHLVGGAIAGSAAGGALLPRHALGRDLVVAAGEKTPAGLANLRFPEKAPLIVLTDRPPNLETPIRYFREDLTPNEAFYVRWHLGITPTRVDVGEYRLKLAGHVQRPLELSLEQLRQDFEPVSVVAVNQCSGNSRSLYQPRMPGVQWGNGAVGNARWTGVRVKDLLAKAGVKAGAVDVTFNGMDAPTLPPAENFAGTPDFIKSLPLDRASDGEVMLAYEMNGKPLPMLNGFPLRVVVPGWFATYWVKSLDEITVTDKPFDGFWMSKAYRVPNTPDFQEDPKDLAQDTVPIHRMTVRSLIVSPEPTEKVAAGQQFEVQGVAFDGGNGIKKVEVSTDGGKNWSEAKLGQDLGRYSWHRWRLTWKPRRGQHRIMAKATSTTGETQTNAQWNRSGYARNVIESVDVNVA